MLANHLKLSFRKLAKQRSYTILNVLGLGLSIGCGILIFALLRHHSRFDTYHTHADRIVRVMMDVKTESLMPFSGAPLPMAKAMREESSLFEVTAMRSAEDDAQITVVNDKGQKTIYRENDHFAWVEPGYFQILDVPLLRGDLKAIEEPNTVFISEKLARKYFGDADPMGKLIRVENETDLRIAGILQNLPTHTDYPHDILASWATLKQNPRIAADLDSWQGARGANFCLGLLHKGRSMQEMDALMADFRKKHPHPESADLFQYKALPMTGLHFDMDYGFGNNKNYLLALGFIGIFLLITACVNFVNMATAQALTRTREVGVRKSLGSTRTQLFWQFLAETGIIVGISITAGLFAAWMALPSLNRLLEVDIQPDAALLSAVAGFIVLLGLLLTLLAGWYPGWMQSRFNPVLSMKGAADIGSKSSGNLRKTLVTTQFVISQALIIGAVVVTAQMQFVHDADWGFRPGAVVVLNIPSTGPMQQFRQSVAQLAGVQNVSLCYQPPASDNNSHTGIVYDNRPEPEPWLVSNKSADAQYLETFGLQLVAGRNLYPADTLREVLVNETFVKKLNLASPADIIGKTILYDKRPVPIVGVIKDFLHWSPSEPVAAILIGSMASNYRSCAIQLQPGNPAPVLEKIKALWSAAYPDNYCDMQFMDDRVAEFMESESTLLQLVAVFAGIAIFIGCMGLYGLSAFMVARKKKEIGIRKTLGAGVSGIIWLFGKEYTRLILIAFVIAAPLTWKVMNGWLADYNYRIHLNLILFLIPLGATFAIAVFTVGLQSIRAALANPVSSLRAE